MHVHVRDATTGLGTQDVAVFSEVVDWLRAETDAILCLDHQRHPRAQPQHRGAAGAVGPTAGDGELRRRLINTEAGVFSTRRDFLDAAAAAARERGVKLELECFDIGMIVTALRYHAQRQDPGAAALPVPFRQQVRHAGDGARRWPTPSTCCRPAPTWSVIGVGPRRRPWRCWPCRSAGTCASGSRTTSSTAAVSSRPGTRSSWSEPSGWPASWDRPVATPAEARRLLGLA